MIEAPLPCLDCQTLGGRFNRNRNRPARVQGRCVRCYDKLRYRQSRPASTRRPRRPALVPSPSPTTTVGPLAWLVDAWDRRDHAAILAGLADAEMEDAA